MSINVPMTVAPGGGIGFTSSNGDTTSTKTVALLRRVEIVKTETLRTYNGTAGYTLSQGQ